MVEVFPEDSPRKVLVVAPLQCRILDPPIVMYVPGPLLKAITPDELMAISAAPALFCHSCKLAVCEAAPLIIAPLYVGPATFKNIDAPVNAGRVVALTEIPTESNAIVADPPSALMTGITRPPKSADPIELAAVVFVRLYVALDTAGAESVVPSKVNEDDPANAPLELY